jgi:6-hydroxycyclohex-1-ene-1-carbonyl-CoA dehydrogenase
MNLEKPMGLNIQAWQMVAPGEPMERTTRVLDLEALAPHQVVVEVAGCGVCHTDLGFVYDGVRTRHALPLALGHEVAGRVVHTGPDHAHLLGKAVVVPAVIPCGDCAPCKAGRGAICPSQFFPGNDDHGGFASHVVVPGRGLCVVDEARLDSAGLQLSTLSVVADAVTTPYQAILNANLASGDVAIFIGVGGVGAFGAQLATAMGAIVVAIDVDPVRLERVEPWAELCLASDANPHITKGAVRAWAKEQGLAPTGWKIFETSGHPAGQALAYALLSYDAHLAVVGYTRAKIEVRLSNLMAFDATVRGTWGCLPEHYAAVIDRVLDGDVVLDPFVEHRPMGEINHVFEALHAHTLKRRPVLVPDF